MEDFSGLWFDCETINSLSGTEQCNCEQQCSEFLKPFTRYSADMLEKLQYGQLVNIDKEIRLLRSMHAVYLLGGLQSLPAGYISLDASRPWIIYWILHALYLLDKEPTYLFPRIVSTLNYIQHADGGYGGGPGQLSQGAPNYASVMALCIIGTENALSSVNRPAMYHYLMSMKQSNGGFRIHHDGEVDTRGVYTALAVARVLNIMTPELTAGVTEFLLRCQTYEGGFGGEPFNEAHGGYNYCALAALMILGTANQCDVDALEHWLLSRQMKLEGGFQGRTNKLVDSCYSFWQGAAVAMLEVIRRSGSDVYDMEQYLLRAHQPERIDPETGEIDATGSERIHRVRDTSGTLLFNQKALQRYILHCAQSIDNGGMRDKPGKPRDFYHSCYALSGLSVSQCCHIDAADRRQTAATDDTKEGKAEEEEEEELPEVQTVWDGPQVYGDLDNLLEPTSLVFNIGLRKLDRALKYYSSLANSHEELLELYEKQLV